MVARVQNRTAVSAPALPPVATRKASTTAPAASTAKAGWSAGSANSASLRLVESSLDGGTRTIRGVPAPKGFTLSTGEDKRTVTVKLANGKKASFEMSNQSLSIRGADGKTRSLIASDEARIREDVGAFKEQMQGLSRDDAQYANGWEYNSHVSGAGTAGQLVSVLHSNDYMMGGPHPDGEQVLKTFDARTGKQVALNKLLSPAQFKALCDTVEQRLKTMKVDGEDVTGSDFSMGGDRAYIEEKVANNFALVTDSKGKVQIDVDWGSGSHALAPYRAHFTFDAPTDARFRTTIGAN